MKGKGLNMVFPDRNLIALSVIHRKAILWKNANLEQYGLSAAQDPIIVLVCRENGISQNEIVEKLELEKSVVAKSIGKLVDNGFIVRERSKTDRRAFFLYPTQKAKEIYPILIENGNDCMKLLTQNMEPDEIVQLTELLKKLMENALHNLSDFRRKSS